MHNGNDEDAADDDNGDEVTDDDERRIIVVHIAAVAVSDDDDDTDTNERIIAVVLRAVTAALINDVDGMTTTLMLSFSTDYSGKKELHRAKTLPVINVSKMILSAGVTEDCASAAASVRSPYDLADSRVIYIRGISYVTRNHRLMLFRV